MDNRFEEMYADGTLAELLVNCKKEELADALKVINEEYKNYNTVKCHTYDDSDAAGYKTAGFHPTETDFYFVFMIRPVRKETASAARRTASASAYRPQNQPESQDIRSCRAVPDTASPYPPYTAYRH